jgi:hypothetical protein
MKKRILILSLLLIGFTQIGFAQAEKFNFTWTFHFEIASYAQDCNSGLGLCFIPPKFSFRTVEAGVIMEERVISFHILRASLHEELERELNRITQFPIREGTIIPIEISKKLGYNREIELKPVNSPIQISDDSITITCFVE